MATRGGVRFDGAFAAGLAGALAALLAAIPAKAASVPPAPEPAQVLIGGGAVDSAAFRWSSALAEILSRPPGLPDCDPIAPCGVPGVVAGSQTYDDTQTLLNALIDGKMATAIIPALDVYRARCFPPKGQTATLTVLKVLYRQPLQIVARSGPANATPKSFARKTIAVGERGSDSESVAMALIDAYGLSRAKVKLVRLSPALALAAVKTGGAVAAVFVGHAADGPIGDLLAQGFTLMPLPDTAERRRLLQALPVFEPDVILTGAYPGLPAISTLAQPVPWVAGPGLDPKLAQKLVADIAEPHNLIRLSGLIGPVAAVPEGEAFLSLPAPPAVGAAEFARSANLPVETLTCPAGAAH